MNKYRYICKSLGFIMYNSYIQKQKIIADNYYHYFIIIILIIL